MTNWQSGALYESHVVGNDAHVSWRQVLNLLEPLTKREFGNIRTILVFGTNDIVLETNSLESAELRDFDDLPIGYCLKAGLDKRDAQILICQESTHWEICLCLLAHDPELNDDAAQHYLIELWELLLPLKPLFAAAGEETEVWEVVDAAIDGTGHPRSAYHCDITILGTELAKRIAGPDSVVVPGGALERFGSYFRDEREFEPYPDSEKWGKWLRNN